MGGTEFLGAQEPGFEDAVRWWCVCFKPCSRACANYVTALKRIPRAVFSHLRTLRHQDGGHTEAQPCRITQSCSVLSFCPLPGLQGLCHWCSFFCCLQAHRALKAGCLGKEAAASCAGESRSGMNRAGLVCKEGVPVPHQEPGHSLGTLGIVSPTWNPLLLSHVTTHDFLSWLHKEVGFSWSVNFSKHYKIPHM